MSVRILMGDVFDRMAEIPDESVHCVVTSPPYWGLRDYGVEGQIGLEPTMAEFVETMVRVFSEVRRVLRADGTCWLNLGDSYSTHAAGVVDDPMKKSTLAGVKTQAVANQDSRAKGRYRTSSIPEKNLLMIPNRVAIALQDDGWWVRSEIIWSKPNPMPESVTDRPASAHEKVWLLSKSARYWYDAEAVRRPAARPDWAFETPTTPGNNDRNDGGCTQRKPKPDKQSGHGPRHAGFNGRWEENPTEGANLRNVWTMATRAFPDAHFATFPPELPETCIKAGTSEKGCCAECGASRVREVDIGKTLGRTSKNGQGNGQLNKSGRFGDAQTSTTGWAHSCQCNADTVPCTVLDPFGGAGTTGLVADRLGRDAILIELNHEYAAMAKARIEGDAPLFADVSA